MRAHQQNNRSGEHDKNNMVQKNQPAAVAEEIGNDLHGCLDKSLLDDMLSEAKDRRDLKDLDPAQGGCAEQQFSNILQNIRINDDRLRQTHETISSVFRLGMHKGWPVDELVSDFINGTAKPSDLPALVALEWKGQLWVVFGNRHSGHSHAHDIYFADPTHDGC